jgi:hypothetical protein
MFQLALRDRQTLEDKLKNERKNFEEEINQQREEYEEQLQREKRDKERYVHSCLFVVYFKNKQTQINK